MKFKIFVLVIILISFIFSKKSKRSATKSKVTTNLWVKPLIKTAKSYVSFANLPYCNLDAIETLACPLCSSILDGSFKVVKADKINQHGSDFKYALLLSETNEEVIISFSGPKSTETKFYKKLWVEGFQKLHQVNVEKAYVAVYENLSATLKLSLTNLLKDHPTIKENYKFIFVGHSFGGSLAVLSAYDMVSSKLINANASRQSPLVYTYGQLRIGDSDFVSKVNESFKVVRIIKDNDYMTRAPHCVPSTSNNWKCYEKQEELVHHAPELKNYIMHSVNGKILPGSVVANDSSDPRRSSFLEKKKKRGVYYSTNNPGFGVNTWGFGLNSQSSNSNGKIYYSQPIGAEVIYSSTFDSHKVCQYFSGIPNCERQLPKSFSSDDHAFYFGENLESC